jgi:hypothetical protein
MTADAFHAIAIALDSGGRIGVIAGGWQRRAGRHPGRADVDARANRLAIRRAERERRRAAWEPLRAHLQRAADLLLAQQLRRASDVRVLERFIGRLDRTIS